MKDAKKRGVYLDFEVGDTTGALYMPLGLDPAAPRCPAVYLLGSEEKELKTIVSLWNKPEYRPAAPVALAAIHPRDWSADYSPLKAPPLRPGEKPFGDGAGEYLEKIGRTLIPELEKKYNLASSPANRTLVGYSLAGLCALYGAFTAEGTFSRFGGVSPSLWLEGFSDLMESLPISPAVRAVYLSLGKKEPVTKNPRMARVGEEFEKASALLSAKLPAGAFLSEWNDGNHFYEPERRIARAIAFLTRD
ncbi:MAG: alpha/beta hydrolase [Clostridia bacterium]|nr:alpha/beta hydrolase [Clostridia bacterium]